MKNELHAAYVLSTEVHAKIVSIDASAALALAGVEAFITAKDVPNNHTGPVEPDDEIFASEIVRCIGYPIGVILAHSRVFHCSMIA
jgi:xanthine dehydrogenase/oxidase